MQLKAGFEAFYTGTGDTVYRIIKSSGIPKDTARDLVMETFGIVHDKWDHISELENPIGYTVRIAQNLARRHFRKNKGVISLDNLPSGMVLQSGEKSPEETAIERFRLDIIEKELSKLSDKERAIIIMRDAQAMDFQSIAAEMAMKLPTAKSLYRRARLKIAERLEDEV